MVARAGWASSDDAQWHQFIGHARNSAFCAGDKRARVSGVMKGGSSIVAMFCDIIQNGP